jgi:hypothetical protein|tara:strand:+ start:82 stop:492 length:411 start_codon:yes stop_codon:yes gene_type:complete
MKSLKPKLTTKVKGRKVELPAKTIKIGYTNYEIQVWDKMTATSNEAYGEFYEKEQVIGIDGNQKGGQLVNTLLHEIMHGIIFQYGLKLENETKTEVKEEHIVNATTNGLSAVFMDNPWLLPWMEKEITKDISKNKE